MITIYIAEVINALLGVNEADEGLYDKRLPLRL